MSNQSPPIPYTSREYAQVLKDLKAFVASTNSGLVSDFTESNAGTMLLSIAAAVTDVISAGQDFAAAEAFLATCRTYEGALRFAKSVGYVPHVATAATVTVVCNPLPASITSGGATVPAGQTLTIAGLNYNLLADVVIPSSSTVFSFPLVQADASTETFGATNQPYQVVSVQNGVVAQDSWQVFVGDDTNPANEWTQTDEILLLTSSSNSYQVRFDAQGRLSVLFGNGVNGAVPTQTITVKYQTTSGAAGNLPVFGVTGNLTATISGGTASLAVSNTQGPASGGGDRESLAELKRNIPAYLRTNQRVVTLQDYEDFLSQQPGVALAYSDISIASYEANVVKGYIWGTENVTFTATSSNLSVRSAVPYKRYTQVTPQQVNAAHKALELKTMVSVHNRVLRPTLAYADIYAGQIKADPRYDFTALHLAVTTAVVGVFQNSGGFTVSMNDINDAINQVPGVRRFNIQRVVWDYLRAGNATGSIVFSGNPADGDTVSINDGVMGFAYEFDSNSSISSGRVRVVIGNSAESTATNLINAINQTLAIRAYRNPSLGGPTVSLVQSRVGDTFNLPLVKNSSVLTVNGMTGGTYTRVAEREDRRLDQNPIPDPFPIGTYTVGSNATTGWVTGGVSPYYPLKDLEIMAVKTARNLYDEQYLFNDEIRYDSGVELTPDVQAINLRRLVFDIVADDRTRLGF